MTRKSVRPLAPGSGEQAANLNTRFYEQIAPIYDNLYEDVDTEEAVRQWRLLIERHAALPRQREATLPRLLDLGCGTGRYLDAWAAAGFSVTGVDASRTMIARARDLRKTSAWASRIRLACSDLRKTCRVLTTGGRFDIAVAHLNFLNLFQFGEISEVLRQLVSCMTEGARLFTDCASPALMPEPSSERIIFADGEVVEVTTEPDAVNATVTRSYLYRGSRIAEKYWLHSDQALSRAADSAGWSLESIYSWRPDRPMTPWLQSSKRGNGHRMCVFKSGCPSATRYPHP
jgi:SAM-dependent methyltransferase